MQKKIAFKYRNRCRKLIKSMYKFRYEYLLLLPIIIFFILFNYIPMFGATIAFKEFNFKLGIFKSPWIGFYNFRRLFGSISFMQVFLNTIIISFLKIIFCFPAPIILALIINEIESIKLKKFFQTVSYMPYFFSWVIIAIIIEELLSPSHGVVNYIISLFGKEPIYFLTEAGMFRGIIIVSALWQSVGWGTIIYLAAITGIDTVQYEAAYIDGATRFQIIRRIIIPSILPVISIMLILTLGGIMNAGFEQIFNLYNPMVYKTGDIIDTYVYRIGLVDFNYSYATAVNLFKNTIGFVLLFSTNIVVRKLGEGENALW